jgi:hypothetical protein
MQNNLQNFVVSVLGLGIPPVEYTVIHLFSSKLQQIKAVVNDHFLSVQCIYPH